MDPEALRNVPTDEPYDFSKQLFPLLLEKGRPMYGHVVEGYWKDIGNLDQYREANFDALDEKVQLEIPGSRLRGNVWVGEGVELGDVATVAGARIHRQRTAGSIPRRRSARTPCCRRASSCASTRGSPARSSTRRRTSAGRR